MIGAGPNRTQAALRLLKDVGPQHHVLANLNLNSSILIISCHATPSCFILTQSLIPLPFSLSYSAQERILGIRIIKMIHKSGFFLLQHMQQALL